MLAPSPPQDTVMSFDESYIEIVVALALLSIHPLDTAAMDQVLLIKVSCGNTVCTMYNATSQSLAAGSS